MKKIVFVLFFVLSITIIFVSCGKNETEETNESFLIISSKFNKFTCDGAMANNQQSHEDINDYSWSEDSVNNILFNTNLIVGTGIGFTISGTIITISKPGTYRFNGNLSNGRIIINSLEDGVVRLLFSGVNISNETGSVLNVVEAEKVIVYVESGTDNLIEDSDTYIFDDLVNEEPDAAVFSNADLTIAGSGSLEILANFKDGLKSKDGLIVKNVTLNITSVDDGISGKDYLIIDNANVEINAGGDALKSTNDEQLKRGYVLIENSNLVLVSAADGIQAQTDLLFKSGTADIKSGGGSGHSVSGTNSSKGLKAGGLLITDGGNLIVNSADDALHSDSYLCVNGGSFTISTADDGVHSDSIAGITGGSILITKSYEGIESRQITITGGEMHLTSSDDGVNISGASQSSGFGGNPNSNLGEVSEDYFLYLHGGYVAVYAGGDGIDINGSIFMDEGVLIVHGPTENMNGAIDYDYSFTINGGTLIAAGSSGMAQAPDATSSQYSVMLKFNTSHQAGSLITLQTTSGDDVVSFSPSKQYQSFVFSSPALTDGMSLVAYLNGSNSGTALDGIYTGGTYTAGTQFSSFKIRSVVEVVQ